ncbi:alpha/beta hydrolase [Rhodococcus maanshanensis]|uniref:alpha/beta hydrolase family protein n=1 Tax=Rhodococcus maanshanensis TaxID=183556 RepID=UPI0022B56DC5|nr:alpha/beta hydrolase [Rhodococcus maanshanensis]MCZ4558552.1 alpha/beta hydrolase [Rhodococcus maanshanensis]
MIKISSRIVPAVVLALALPLTTAAVGAASPVAAADAGSSAIGTVFQLPSPTGAFAVGRNTLHLVDESRPDPWVTSDRRELMVSMYYPAHPGAGARARYATTEEIRLLLEGQELAGLVPAEVLSATGTHSVVDAVPVEGSYPMVVLSPGFTASRYTLTALAEELAARGYVVAAVDHANESFGTEFPGGRMSTCLACGRTEDEGTLGVVTATRAADVSFLLDRLTAPDSAWPHSRLIDRERIGMAGHSIGGGSTAETMASDDRVRAGVNMDGSFHISMQPDGVKDRPFLMMGTDDEVHRPGGRDVSWDAAWSRLVGWKRWLTVAGAGHASFTDIPALAERLGMPVGAASPIGAALPGGRSVDLTRVYVGAFFDQHLRGVPQPILDGPSPAYPEVRFNNP